MKKLIILIVITISAISLSKAQSEVKINMEDLQADISNELAKLPSMADLNLNLDAMKIEIKENLTDLDNMSNLVDLNLDNLNLRDIIISSTQPEANIIVSDSGSNLAYAYTTNEASNKENGFSYSYTINETPQNSDIFNQLSNVKGVQVVYISKSLLGMMPKMDMPGVDIGNIAGKLESLEIYSADEESAARHLTNISESLLKGDNYETLMLIKESDSKTAFYVKKNKSNQGSEMLMITNDGADATIIRFLGSFTIEDIKNIANQGKGMNINTSINTSSKLSEEELNLRIKEAQKRNEEAQRIANEAQKRADKAIERAKRLEDKALERAKSEEERATKAN